MNNSVILKGNRYGISIVLNDKTDFKTIVKELGNRLEKASDFFDCDKQLAVAFEGRNLSNEELDQLLCVITEKSNLNIQYVLDENSDLEATFFDIIHSESENDINVMDDIKLQQQKEEINTLSSENNNYKHSTNEKESIAMFYKGTLRSGQALEAKESLIVIGDVNPGASVIAGKNIIIIGNLKGSVCAGSNGDTDAFVMALSMNPIQIQIADIIQRSSDNRFFGKTNKDAMIARIEQNHIVMDSVSKSTILDMKY